MKDIIDHNINAIIAVATIFVKCFGYEDNEEIFKAAALACKSGVMEWYMNKGIAFDITTERIDPDALEYAGLKLGEIQRLALDASFDILSTVKDNN